MANEQLEDFENEFEDRQKKKKDDGGLVGAVIVALIFGMLVNIGMYFFMRETLEDQREKRFAEQAAADSLAALDSLSSENSDSLLKEPPEIDDVPVEEGFVTQQQPARVAVDSSEVKREEKIKKVAKILSAMEPKQAAAAISTMDEREAALILVQMSSRASGEIFDNLHPNKATAISRRIMYMEN